MNAQCGGVIIGNHNVLTAAHCCQSAGFISGKIMLGSNRFVDPNNQQTLSIEAFRIHEKWNMDNYQGDICVIKTKGKFRCEFFSFIINLRTD